MVAFLKPCGVKRPLAAFDAMIAREHGPAHAGEAESSLPSFREGLMSVHVAVARAVRESTKQGE